MYLKLIAGVEVWKIEEEDLLLPQQQHKYDQEYLEWEIFHLLPLEGTFQDLLHMYQGMKGHPHQSLLHTVDMHQQLEGEGHDLLHQDIDIPQEDPDLLHLRIPEGIQHRADIHHHPHEDVPDHLEDIHQDQKLEDIHQKEEGQDLIGVLLNHQEVHFTGVNKIRKTVFILKLSLFIKKLFKRCIIVYNCYQFI